MRHESLEEVAGSLVCTYGPFQVYRLMVWKNEDTITESCDYHLIVLVDDHDEMIEAIWHYDARVDLPWIAYAVKRYLSLREQMIDDEAQRLERMRQPEHMARLQEWFEAQIALRGLSKEKAPYLSAESMLARHQHRVDWLQSLHNQMAAALHDVEATSPEPIHDVSGEARAEYEQLMRRIAEGRRRAEQWRPYVAQGIHDYHPFLGSHVLQAGPFHVYQDLGKIEKPSLHSGADFDSGANVPYMILFEDDTLGTFDIGGMRYRYVPSPLQVCRPTRSWFAHMSNAIDAVLKAMSEAKDPIELHSMQAALRWRQQVYHVVYDAWETLSCLTAPDDNPDPVYDPTTTAGFRAIRAFRTRSGSGGAESANRDSGAGK